MSTFSLIFILLFRLAFSSTLSSQSFQSSLFHQRSEKAIIQSYNAALNCTDVRLPPAMCPSCHLLPFDSRGQFNTTYVKDIIDFETSQCLEQIKEYIRLNPCDTLRAKYFDQYKTNGFARIRMAQFMYSVCEQCCDCVTVGSEMNEWKTRKMDHTLHKLTRGNCPAHMHYDICKMFPNLTRFIGPTSKEKKGLPKICPLLEDWINSNYSVWWAGNPDADGLGPTVINAFRLHMKNAGCENRRLWQDCVRFEKSLGRI